MGEKNWLTRVGQKKVGDKNWLTRVGQKKVGEKNWQKYRGGQKKVGKIPSYPKMYRKELEFDQDVCPICIDKCLTVSIN